MRFGDPVPNVKTTLFVDFKVDPQSASSEKEKKAEKQHCQGEIDWTEIEGVNLTKSADEAYQIAHRFGHGDNDQANYDRVMAVPVEKRAAELEKIEQEYIDEQNSEKRNFSPPASDSNFESVSEAATEKLASATTDAMQARKDTKQTIKTMQVREHTMETISLPRGHVVVRAFYGGPKRQKGKDVTGKVRALIAGGKKVFASNSLFAQLFFKRGGIRGR